MNNFKLGRIAPIWTPQHRQLAARIRVAFTSLGKPPATPYDYVSAVSDLVGPRWGMMLNDTWGDCTAADTGHTDMIVKANTGTWTHVPTDAEVIAFYSATTGFDAAKTDANGDNPTDQGAVESDVCDFLVSTGFLGNQAAVTAPIVMGAFDDKALEKIRWCIQLFGSCRIGVNLPKSAEPQFERGAPWALGGDETVDGGHDVPFYNYEGDDFFGVTWGGQPNDARGLQRITGDWLRKFGDEAHAVIYSNLVMSSGQTPAGFDMAQLTADLKALAA